MAKHGKVLFARVAEDVAAGERAARWIESYRLPGALRGRDFGRGPLPARLAPMARMVFRGGGEGELSLAQRAAIEQAEALILVCSPIAARTPLLGALIEHFQRQGAVGRIFLLVAEGAPRRNDPLQYPDGAIHPALYATASPGAGHADDQRFAFSVDVRTTGDGLEFACLRLISGLTGAPTNLLSHARAGAGAGRFGWPLLAGLFAVWALGATGHSIMGSQARDRDASGSALIASCEGPGDLKRRYGVSRAVAAALTDEAKAAVDGDAGRALTSLSRARARLGLAESYLMVGAPLRALDQVSQAQSALSANANVWTGGDLGRAGVLEARLRLVAIAAGARRLNLEQRQKLEPDAASESASDAFEPHWKAFLSALEGKGPDGEDGQTLREAATAALIETAKLDAARGEVSKGLKRLADGEGQLRAPPHGEKTLAPARAAILAASAQMMAEFDRLDQADALMGQAIGLLSAPRTSPERVQRASYALARARWRVALGGEAPGAELQAALAAIEEEASRAPHRSDLSAAYAEALEDVAFAQPGAPKTIEWLEKAHVLRAARLRLDPDDPSAAGPAADGLEALLRARLSGSAASGQGEAQAELVNGPGVVNGQGLVNAQDLVALRARLLAAAPGGSKAAFDAQMDLTAAWALNGHVRRGARAFGEAALAFSQAAELGQKALQVLPQEDASGPERARVYGHIAQARLNEAESRSAIADRAGANAARQAAQAAHQAWILIAPDDPDAAKMGESLAPPAANQRPKRR